MWRSLLSLVVLGIVLSAPPAHGKLTLGAVADRSRLLSSESQARLLADYLSQALEEGVAAQLFPDEKILHERLSRYRLVDLAVLSRQYLAGVPKGEFFPLAAYVLKESPGSLSEELLVARQGLNPWQLQKLEQALLAMGDSPKGREVLAGLGALAMLAPGTRAEELPQFASSPVVAAAAVPPLPVAPAPVATANDAKASAVADLAAQLGSESPALAPQPAPVAKSAESPPPVEKPAPRPVAQNVPRNGEALLEIPSREGRGERLASGAQASYRVEPVAKGVFAAISRPGGATSNAFFAVGSEYVVAGGAHMTKAAVGDLIKAIRVVSDKPLRYFILTHHHAGYSHVDFDFPTGVDLLIPWQTWKSMDEEIRELDRPTLFYSDGLTLRLGEQTIILTNMGRAHTVGDALVFFPESEVLFTSDLVYVDSVGYMGDGHMEDWLLALEFIERLGAKKIIPGYGPVSGNDCIAHFKDFFRNMMTEVLRHLERGDSLDQTLQTFSLPGYGGYNGYEQFLRSNVRRAYQDLQENIVQ